MRRYFKIELLQILEGCSLFNSFAVQVNGTSLFIVIKYTRLKPRLIKNKFSQKKINLD